MGTLTTRTDPPEPYPDQRLEVTRERALCLLVPPLSLRVMAVWQLGGVQQAAAVNGDAHLAQALRRRALGLLLGVMLKLLPQVLLRVMLLPLLLIRRLAAAARLQGRASAAAAAARVTAQRCCTCQAATRDWRSRRTPSGKQRTRERQQRAWGSGRHVRGAITWPGCLYPAVPRCLAPPTRLLALSGCYSERVGAHG